MPGKSPNSDSANPQTQTPGPSAEPNTQETPDSKRSNLKKEIISDLERDAVDAIEKRTK